MKVLKQELISKCNALSAYKSEHKEETERLKKALIDQRNKCSGLTLRLEQNEFKMQHSETKLRNLQRTLIQKTKEVEKCKIKSRVGGKNDESPDAELNTITKQMSLDQLKLQKSEDQQEVLRKELEEKDNMIQDQADLLKAIKLQMEEANEISEQKLHKKISEIEVLRKDIDFKNKNLEDEVRKNSRLVKNKDIEIERLQDKVQMLEIKMAKVTPKGSPVKVSKDEKKQSDFNYQAHYVIEENLRERISELKKDLAEKKETIESITSERNSIETQLIHVKTQLANSEFEKYQFHMSPDMDDSDDE